MIVVVLSITLVAVWALVVIAVIICTVVAMLAVVVIAVVISSLSQSVVPSWLFSTSLCHRSRFTSSVYVVVLILIVLSSVS